MSIIQTKKSLFRRTVEKIDYGRTGGNLMLPAYPLNRASRHIGIGRRLYTLIGADSGVGKSAFMSSCYVLGPYTQFKSLKDKGEAPFDIRWVIRAMERDAETTMAKWMCSYLFGKYRILMDVNFLMTRGVKRAYVPDEIYEMVLQTEKFFVDMEEHVTVISGSENPTGIYRDMQVTAAKYGSFSDLPAGRKLYTPDDPTRVIVYAIDHIGLLRGETIAKVRTNGGDKLTLDKMGEYLKSARDDFGFSPLVVCQLNRGQFDPRRRNKATFELEPGDFHGSSQMFWDADQVLGLFAPHRLGFDAYKGYNVPALTSAAGYNRFRMMTLMKNNIGIDNVSFGLHFIGECGLFLELPVPDKMTPDEYQRRVNLPQTERRLVMAEQ